MKTILIPTDFTQRSLDCIPGLCSQYDTQKISFVFVHMFKLSDSIGDLLMLSRRSREFENISDDFYTRCTTYKSQLPNIEAIKIEFFYGSTMSMFRNFLENHEVDCVLNPSDCSYSKINKASIDPLILIGKSGLPVVTLMKVQKMETAQQPRFVQEPQLAEA
ncbi:MAG: hypothetical protein EOO89_22415 [Pedobacter sp.]|nr:MAG: hypothetical protein EOO89_22415 [Pedobacter sp.]